MPFFIKTGNHHLFLILRSAAGQEWIVLLGKRRPNFPFLGTRFENATLYNVTARQLRHWTGEEMTDLVFECGKSWTLTGQRPVPFSLTLQPQFLAERRKVFGKIVFRYHALTLLSGKMGGEEVAGGHGFSEQGRLSLLPFEKLQVPFEYLLLLNADAKGGSVEWKASPLLRDCFVWGRPFQKVSASLCTLAQTPVPLKNWTLHRKIVKATGPEGIAYGLQEWFEK